MRANTLRTFFALDISPQLRAMLARIQNDLKALDCNVKWVEPQHMHMTLKFLGDVKSKKIAEISQCLVDIFDGAKHIPIELTGLGAFPSLEHPRVIWASIKDAENRIAQIAKEIEAGLGRIGIKKSQKPFSAHLTLGRVRSPRNINELVTRLKNYTLPAGFSQKIDRAVLYKSTLTRVGPVYEALKTFTLS